MKIEIAVPAHLFTWFRDRVLNTWFDGDQPLLTRHCELSGRLLEACSFESDHVSDFYKIREICFLYNARILSVV